MGVAPDMVYQCFFCVGVKLHSLNMSSVMSRVSNGVRAWVSALDRSWRLTQGRHGRSRAPSRECVRIRPSYWQISAAAGQWVGILSPRDVKERVLLENVMKRVVSVRSRGSEAVGPQELRAVVDLRFHVVVVFLVPLRSGRFRLISRTRVQEAMMFHVTPATWPILANRGPKWCPKKGKGLGRARHQGVILTSPSSHAGLSCATQSVKESRALQCRHSREGGSPEAPRVVPGHARRSLRDVDVLQQHAEKKARAGR